MLTERQIEHFNELLRLMPSKPGYTKWICAHVWHVDPVLGREIERCPQCQSLYHPMRGYMKEQGSDAGGMANKGAAGR